MLFRLRSLDWIRRRVMGPLFAYGLVTIFLQPFALHVLPRIGVSTYNVFLVQIRRSGCRP